MFWSFYIKIKGLDLRGHERASIKKQIYYVLQKYRLGKQVPALRNKKENFYYIFFILLTAKVCQNSSLKIFASTDCGYAFFLLSANIYQATLSVRKGLFSKSLKLILNRLNKSRSSPSA